MQDDWLQYMRLFGQAAGAMNGAGAFGGGGLTMDPAIGAPVMPPPQIDPSGLALPGAGPMASPIPAMPNAGLPSTPGAVPPVPMSIGPSPDPANPYSRPGFTGLAPATGPVGGAPLAPAVPTNTIPDPSKPAGYAGPPNWFDRNIGQPLSELWNGKPKLDASGKPIIGPDGKPVMEETAKLTDRQKALVGGASSIGSALAKGATPAAAPTIAAGGGGAGAYKPAAFDAARLAASRVAELQALKQKAALNAPWLRRYQQPGLMGG
jgi:hypothetical protein